MSRSFRDSYYVTKVQDGVRADCCHQTMVQPYRCNDCPHFKAGDIPVKRRDTPAVEWPVYDEAKGG